MTDEQVSNAFDDAVDVQLQLLEKQLSGPETNELVDGDAPQQDTTEIDLVRVQLLEHCTAEAPGHGDCGAHGSKVNADTLSDCPGECKG